MLPGGIYQQTIKDSSNRFSEDRK